MGRQVTKYSDVQLIKQQHLERKLDKDILEMASALIQMSEERRPWLTAVINATRSATLLGLLRLL